jgi:pantoate--beta-alanine ligase
MGALHAGHASLIRRSAEQNDKTIVSIFVNPTQFGPDEDLGRYPRSLEEDTILARAAGADYVYAPSVEEVYPNGLQAGLNQKVSTRLDLTTLNSLWEAELRPGHFDGVLQVVERLFDLVKPQRAYFGEKDFQQLRIVEEMTRQLSVPVEIVRCPSIRDEDGLVLSSRNRYLSGQEREAARSILPTLRSVQDGFRERSFDANVLLLQAQARLSSELELEYLDVVRERDLRALNCAVELTGEQARLIFAGRVGTTRILDNLPLPQPSKMV